jgi:glutathione synthase/RimK-type ligase-like ATP-grasp enzyme
MSDTPSFSKVLILAPGETDATTIALRAAYEKQGFAVQVANENTVFETHPDQDTLVHYWLYSEQGLLSADKNRATSTLQFLQACSKLTNPLASVIACADKNISQQMMRYAGIHVPPWMAAEQHLSGGHITDKLRPEPWVVKPFTGSCSVGVALVENLQQAHAANLCWETRSSSAQL